MIFNSIEFLFFLPVVLLAVRGTPARFRWAVLLIASYVFYMAWNPWYIALIIASTLVDYCVARAIPNAQSQRARRAWLATSITVNIGILAVFKYAGLFTQTAEDLATALNIEYAAPAINLLLPVGISFYTFQTLSYTIEVYRGNQQPERHLGRFALYVAFFPQLVAGPIERPGHLIPQLAGAFAWNPTRAREGLALILWGMFKKVVIADRLGVFVDVIFDSPERFNGPYAVLGAIFFAFQIYADFSGYTDIAIGTARMLGVDLMRNFDRPYTAQSIREFWQRWHISLSTWFRDYVYISLGGNRGSLAHWCIAILVVFGLSGLWHGANWTFLIWGLLHGGAYLLERLAAHISGKEYSSASGPITRVLRISLTFAVVCIAWVFFRADSIADAYTYLTAMTRGWTNLQLYALDWITAERSTGGLGIPYALTLIAFLYIAETFARDGNFPSAILRQSTPIRWTWYIATALAIMNLGTLNERPFIYFQF